MLDWLDKLSLQDIAHGIGNVFKLMRKKWYWLVLAIASGAGLGYYTVVSEPPLYEAEYIFALSTESPSAAKGLSGLASQFGLDVTGSGNDAVFSGDNIIELFKTRKIAERALVQPIPATNLNLAQFICKEVEGKPLPNLGDFPRNVEALNVQQLAFIRNYLELVTESVAVFKKDKKLSYYTIQAYANHPDLAYHLARLLLQEASRFFVETKTQVARKNLVLLEKTSDSLFRILEGTVNRSANIADQTFNMNPALVIQRAPVQVNQARITAISAAYTEVLRQVEIAKISLQRETPLYQVIEEPLLPIPPQVAPLIPAVAKWAFVAFLCTLILILLSHFRKSLKKSLEYFK